MPNLLVISCKADATGGYAHTVWNGRRRVLTVILRGVLADEQARIEFRNAPWDFVRRFDLPVVEQPLYFRLRGV